MYRRHLLSLNIQLPLYQPEGDAGGGDGGSSSDTDDLSRDLADLGDPDEPGDGEGAEGDGEGDDEGEEPDADEEGDEEEEEVGGDDEEEEEKIPEGEGKKGKKAGEEEGKADEVDEFGRPTVKAIKAAYPDVFKKFPFLKTAYFTVSKFQEVFADPDAAVEASNKAHEYDQLETSLVQNGDPTLLIKTLETNNPKALKSIIQRLPSVISAIDDPALYTELARPFIEELLYHATNHGTRAQNKNLVLAAKHIANFVWANGGDIPDISKRGTSKDGAPKSEAEKQLEIERAQTARREYNRAGDELEAEVAPQIDKIIGNKLDGLNAFERKQIIKETRRELDKKLSADTAFQRQMGGLWRRAQETGFSPSSMTKIRHAWLERARTVAPGIRNRLKQEALDGRRPQSGTPREGNSDQKGKKRQLPSGGGQARGRSAAGVVDPKKINWRKTSDMDIIG